MPSEIKLKGGWTQDILRDVLETVYRRAATDPEYRNRCLKDGTNVVNEVAQTRGLKLPETTHIRFVNALTEVVYVLPPLVADSKELSDSMLSEMLGPGQSTGSRGQTCC